MYRIIKSTYKIIEVEELGCSGFFIEITKHLFGCKLYSKILYDYGEDDELNVEEYYVAFPTFLAAQERIEELKNKK